MLTIRKDGNPFWVPGHGTLTQNLWSIGHVEGCEHAHSEAKIVQDAVHLTWDEVDYL